jgi:hypothetical protein
VAIELAVPIVVEPVLLMLVTSGDGLTWVQRSMELFDLVVVQLYTGKASEELIVVDNTLELGVV